MTRKVRLSVLSVIFAVILVLPIFSEETENPFNMGMSLVIGTQSFAENGETVTYQKLSFNPDISFGKIGLGLDVTLHYNFTGGENANEFAIRTADWVPDNPVTFSKILGLYLPLIRYVRYGVKGDSIYAKLGSIDDFTLGNGFIMGNYSNTLLLPEKKIFGLSFDLDGSLFNFPLVGFESVVGNLAMFDVIGSRLYVRPFVFTDIPIAKNLQVGATFAADTNVYAQSPDLDPDTSVQEGVIAFGTDFRLPLLSNPAVSLATFGDVASLAGKSVGGMLGFGGKLISFLTYGAQLRILGKNFIPDYFDSSYDLFRTVKYELVNSGNEIPAYVGWFASIGTSFLDDSIVFNIGIDGPFGEVVAGDTDNMMNYPHLTGIFEVKNNILQGFSFDASYDKKLIKTWSDLVSPEDAVIKAQLNYETGPAMISFVYRIKYVPDAAADSNPWEITSGLESSIQLF
ncbi:MAG: hypothetical protein DRP57_11680 [Spirochaetes bacterium]|nr:MAG: hypothetical protein DRP57_11680 [Spirochaetota bacterium]